MSLYLAEVSRRHPDEHILMFLDRAGWHQAKALVVPDNLTLDWLPPYSPQCNPEELVWREVRRQPFGNHDFDSVDAVETTGSASWSPHPFKCNPSPALTGLLMLD